MGCSLGCSRLQRHHSPVSLSGVHAGLLCVAPTELFCVPEWGVCQFAPGRPGSTVLGPGWGRHWFTLGFKDSTFLCPRVEYMQGCSRSHLQYCPGVQDRAGTRLLWVIKSEVSCCLEWGVCWAALGWTGSSLRALGGSGVPLACTHSRVLVCGMLCPGV